MRIRRSFSPPCVGLLSMFFLISGLSAGAEDAGIRIMNEVAAVYTKMQTLAADFTVHQETSPGGTAAVETHGTVKAKKPDLYTIDSEGALPARMNSDGRTVLFYLKQQNAYAQFPAGGQSMNLTVTTVAPLTMFFNPKKLVAPNTPTFSLGKETWNGKIYDCVEQRIGPAVMRFYIGADRIIYRMKVHLEVGEQKQNVDATLRNVRIDAPLSPADFPTLPPVGAQRFEMPVPGSAALQPGRQAPEFTLPQPNGDKLSLGDARKDKKATLIVFWFCACAPCREENPRLQKLYMEFKDKGFGMIAVNSFDDRAAIATYVRQAGLSFPICLDDDGTQHFGIAKKYGVDVYPMSFLLDKDGNVVFQSVGLKEAELRAALEKLGVGATTSHPAPP